MPTTLGAHGGHSPPYKLGLLLQAGPLPASKHPAAAPGIPAAIRAAREAKGLTWYALAQQAGVPNQATIRDIEDGKDVKLSNLRAVANALGLESELVPASV